MTNHSSSGAERWGALGSALAQQSVKMAAGTQVTSDDVPSILYHYTDVAGLLGIVGTNELWASNAVFLNDQTEIEHAVRVTKSVLDELLPANHLEASRSPLAMARHSADLVLADIHAYVQAYVICFCTNGDLLSQWRGYGGGLGAYSLGFSSEKLLTGLRGRLRLAKVEYRPEDQEALAKQLIEGWIDALVEQEVDSVPDLSDVKGDAVQLFLDGMFGYLFGFIAATFKHPSFSEENEYRLIFVKQTNVARDAIESVTVEFRGARGIVLPFIRFGTNDLERPEAPLPFRSIRVGPHPYPNLAESGVRQLLAQRKLSDSVRVFSSSTPLRQ